MPFGFFPGFLAGASTLFCVRMYLAEIRPEAHAREHSHGARAGQPVMTPLPS